MSKAYILSILGGVLVFMCVYIYFNVNFEKFTATDTTPSASEIESLVRNISTLIENIGNDSVPDDFVYIEDKTKIPNYANIVLYYTSFSDKTDYNNTHDVYIGNSQKWNNFFNENQELNFVTTSVQGTIKRDGLALTNTKLNTVGLPAQITTNTALKPFSISFYLKINTMTFPDNTNTIEIFDLALEYPYFVKLCFEKHDTDINKINLTFYVGESTNKYSITIDKSELSNGQQPSCITATFNKGSVQPPYSLHIYVNKLVPPSEETITSYNLTHVPTIGTSGITINKGLQLDGVYLIAFMYSVKVLTSSEHQLLVDYFAGQYSGTTHILARVQNLANTQIANLSDLVNRQITDSSTIRSQLDQCLTSQAAIETEDQNNRFNISMNGIANVSTENLQQCSVLKINDPNETTTATSTSTTPLITNTPAAPGSNFPFNIVIPFLNGIMPKDYRS